MQVESGTNKNYNIAILTASHPKYASGIITFDIMEALKLNGHQVIIISNAYFKSSDENVISIRKYSYYLYLKIKNRLVNTLRLGKKTDPNFYMLTLNQVSQKLRFKKVIKNLPFKPDLILYFFPESFLTAKDLYSLQLATKAPIYWYMMDMAPITGGCHFSWKCQNYKFQCGCCPGIFSKNPHDVTNKIWLFKKKFIDLTDISIISGSEHQYQQLQESSLWVNKKKYKIILPIDTRVFFKVGKNLTRDELNLPLNKKILFFGAVSVTSKRKGFYELADSLKLLKLMIGEVVADNIFIIVAGFRSYEMEKIIPFEHKFLGYLNLSNLAKAYNAADIFICPSIEDSGPMMINQAIVCGTPVVAFEMGVARDLVITNVTGYRAKLKDTRDMASGVKRILELGNMEYDKMSENCLKLGRQVCSFESFVREFNSII